MGKKGEVGWMVEGSGSNRVEDRELERRGDDKSIREKRKGKRGKGKGRYGWRQENGKQGRRIRN
jgi:hypothetical protein